MALARKGGASAHIPYRQTKLTNVLKDSIGGNCNTLMFACIWGEAKHLEETISTLRLASRMMRVQNSASAIEVLDPVKMVKKQERQIKELKQELLMHDALSERTGVMCVAWPFLRCRAGSYGTLRHHHHPPSAPLTPPSLSPSGTTPTPPSSRRRCATRSTSSSRRGRTTRTQC